MMEPRCEARTEDAPPCLELVATTRNTVTLCWGPHKAGRIASTASQDSSLTPRAAPSAAPTTNTPTLSALTGMSIESQGSVFEERERPNYRLQLRERGKPWLTVYWGFKSRVELDNMAPGDSFHFRVQRGQGDWSNLLAASTKDDQAPMVVLHRAISQGLPHRARKFLSQRPLAVDVPDRGGRTALLLSVLRGDPELVYLLLNAGADPNHPAEGVASRTPLMLAAHLGRPPICRALRDRGARWDIADRNGCTSLHYAVSEGAGGGGRPGLPSVGGSNCSTADREEVVRMALEDGADLHARDSYGWTPLMRAAMLGASVSVLTMLVEAGADPRQQDKQGHSALHLAALSGRQDNTALLARHGGDLKARSRHGRSARELGRCWPLSLADGANKGGVDATLAVAAAASTMLKKRAARRKQDELDHQIGI